MKLCKECQARKDRADAAVRRAITDGGFVPVPDGLTYLQFQSMVLRQAKKMNVEVATRLVEREGNQVMRVRHFYE